MRLRFRTLVVLLSLLTLVSCAVVRPSVIAPFLEMPARPAPAASDDVSLEPHRVWTVVLTDDFIRLLIIKGLRPEEVEGVASRTLGDLYAPFRIRFPFVRGVRGKVEPVVAGGSLIEVVAEAPGAEEDLLGRAIIDPFDRSAEVLRADDPRGPRGIMGGNMLRFLERRQDGIPLDAAYAGKAIGIVLAHEIGHSLGLVHLPQAPGEPSLPLVMLPSPGADGILRGREARYYWTHVEAGYLAFVLGLRVP